MMDTGKILYCYDWTNQATAKATISIINKIMRGLVDASSNDKLGPMKRMQRKKEVTIPSSIMFDIWTHYLRAEA